MSETWVQDRTAINHLEKITLLFKWMWKEQSLLDRGIDGQIEICEDERPTGRLIAVQSKGGESYFYRTKNNELTLSLKRKHLSYWNEYALPVIVVGYLPSEGVAYWIYIQEYLDRNLGVLNLSQNIISVPIPSTNIFNIESKQLLSSVFDLHIERIVNRVLKNRDLDMTIIEQIITIAKASKINPANFEATILRRMLEVGTEIYSKVVD